jgi:hypothetical protein
MSIRIARISLHCSIAILSVACGGGSSGTPCTMNDQCPSHFCRADETCAPVESIDASTATDGNGSGTDGGDGLCTPNHDGMITLSELPLVAGRTANFLIATSATWNTAGTSNPDNTRTWDLSGALAGDTEEPLALLSPTGTWWQSSFQTATYATTLSSSSTLLGIFHVDASGVTLVGVVSPSGGATQTELTYDPPAKILSLPFSAGSMWTSTSTVSGTAEGVISDYSEEYDSSVDEIGTMKTPYGTFPVLRVRTDLTRTEGIVTLAQNRTFAWVAECFGSVAQAQSSGVESGEFDDPAEVWRIAP